MSRPAVRSRQNRAGRLPTMCWCDTDVVFCWPWEVRAGITHACRGVKCREIDAQKRAERTAKELKELKERMARGA